MNLKIRLGIHKGTTRREPENSDPGPHGILVLFRSAGEDPPLMGREKCRLTKISLTAHIRLTKGRQKQSCDRWNLDRKGGEVWKFVRNIFAGIGRVNIDRTQRLT